MFPLLLNLASPGSTHCVIKLSVFNLFLSQTIRLFILDKKTLCIISACGWLLSSRTLHLEIHTAYLNSDKKYKARSDLEVFFGRFPNRTISEVKLRSHNLLMAF